MKKRLSQAVFRYTAMFDPAEEGGYTVTVPKLPGLVTEGDTFEEAMVMAQDAIKGYLKMLQENKEPIPEPDESSFTAPIDIDLHHHSYLSA